ncbi:mitochondrial import inner membrane translocase subunit Tim23 [Schistocerca gregaria]|uniref:mitochondrial import inner membrane translocase subunit Tim23 n=1 Tax=Schistocerca gregaria TaxID=7010 RepID=UPI00211E9154|nr:mitochondrial import inner membrane translocase subunit Tim23 [Schistocerca gregaria]
MGDRTTYSGSMYSDFSNKDSDLNVPGSTKNLAPLSPYLNFNPVYLPQSQPEFIFPEGASRQRGRYELAFSQIGVSCMAGATIGGINGFYNGLKSTTLAGHTGKLRRTQLLNYVMKQGAATANTLGVIAVMYSGFGTILSWMRGCDDELNTISAATATGLLYKSSAGLRKCAIGGGVGFTLAAAYCLWSSRDKLQDFRRDFNPARKF